ncbi:MAG: precorrin-6y C5,15-methyltransferase (decarboxylating) subunit CbiE [Bacteroidales bacterium]|jgi:precorrin-6Y C5,15-methyltransferase (decarboxylating)|nr:precorrin-6y C5,15-methyltransferase (decarboxylating) subunit CbiE [Bacteroidales bacterium]
MKRCAIVGISDQRTQWFYPEVSSVISKGKVFSGGKRHHEIMANYLPANSLWIDITVPLSGVFEQYKQFDDIVIIASGDPLFYGFAATVQRECPECEITVYPWFNSLQMLAHRMCLPYQDMRVVSLTGRPWDKFDEAIINGESLIGCLTDRNKTPNAIWKRMQEYGYDNYKMTVGENLGNENEEHVGEFCMDREYSLPNCVILQKTADRNRPFGIPEQDFHLLNGRVNMITKMPIRLLSLSMLDLRYKHSFWDVGFCTGSVSIEAKLQFPYLNVTAFEIREEGRELMRQNSRKFGTPGITTVIGDFLEQDLSLYPAPDAIFIGGHGGRLKEMIMRLKSVMSPTCDIVFNSVSEDSKLLYEEGISEAGMRITSCTRMTIDDHNPIYILKAQ